MDSGGFNLASFTAFDWFLFILLAASVIRAFTRGFLLEACSIAGVVSGILLASWNYDSVAVRLVLWLRPFTSLSFALADIIAFMGIVILVMVLASLAGRFLRAGASSIGLGMVDRGLGAAFGFVRGCLVGVACLMVLTAFDPSARMLRGSQLLPYFLAGAREVSFVVPGALQQQLADGADQIKHNKPFWIKPPR